MWKKFAGELGRELGGPRSFPSSLATFFPLERQALSALFSFSTFSKPGTGPRVWEKVITRQANVVRAQ